MALKKQKYVSNITDIARPIIDGILIDKVGFGFDFVSSWHSVVGDYAKWSYPSKIRWSKKKEIGGATLLINCTSLAELHLQHMTVEICDRVNMFLGYAAIGKIKFKKISEDKLRKSNRTGLTLI
ncbi:DciA family protein [Bartonella sp. DGB1]|uniref:DciA family protein n=1 Tax=Bartonella sp. DGB1 TaxID=3239807 RepID=UPI003524DE5A